MSKLSYLLAALCLALSAPNALQAQSQVAAVDAASARVIVKYKAGSTLMRKQALSATQTHAERAQALGARIGLNLRSGRGVAERTQVVFGSGMSSQALADRLARESDVEYAVPDRRKQFLAAPNDPRYLAVPVSGPVVGQWYLRAPQGAVVSSINAEAAWDVSTGSNSVVVAVLDTGVRFDHPDLKRVVNGGNLLDGYDMVSTASGANDGGGRDADASDPGDWVTSSEANNPLGSFYQCVVENSSWHGTQVAGLIGALTNNTLGMASVGRNVRILPVRVLGKCGGYDSDILVAMRWAAGIAVPGLPANPNPAKVINMSLGAPGACTSGYQQAVDEILAQGTVIVASAGNGTGHAVAEPANCAGVIAVGGLRHVGSKVGYSDLGPEVAISAPAGNCVNTSGTCLFPILTTTNAGTTTPVADANSGSTYTDANNASVGTSFSAPLAAGTAALMLAAQPSLTPAQVRTLIRSTARAFPTTGGTAGIPQCTAPQYNGSGTAIDQGECYCTTSTCGAGMLDTSAALQAVLSQVQIVANIRVLTAAPAINSAIELTAAPTALAAGSPGIKSYAWSVLSGPATISSASNAEQVTLLPSAGGNIGVGLTVVDMLDRSSTAAVSVYVPSPAPEPAPDSGGGGGGALGFGWLLSLMAAVFLIRRTG